MRTCCRANIEPTILGTTETTTATAPDVVDKQLRSLRRPIAPPSATTTITAYSRPAIGRGAADAAAQRGPEVPPQLLESAQLGRGVRAVRAAHLPLDRRARGLRGLRSGAPRRRGGGRRRDGYGYRRVRRRGRHELRRVWEARVLALLHHQPGRSEAVFDVCREEGLGRGFRLDRGGCRCLLSADPTKSWVPRGLDCNLVELLLISLYFFYLV
jgi:hypothetical protein